MYKGINLCKSKRAEYFAACFLAMCLLSQAARAAYGGTNPLAFFRQTLQKSCAAENSAAQLFWWTCAESNRGLTGFVCGHYTLSL